jgi:hypothetical protein
MCAIEFRLPPVSRWFYRIFSLVWCGFTAFIAVVWLAFSPPTPWMIVPLLMLLFGVVIGVRLWRLGVTVRGDELEARNYLRTWHVHRREISGFQIGTWISGDVRSTGVLLLRSDQKDMMLDVTRHATIWRFTFGMRTLEVQLAELNQWLHRETTT